jgi:type I restriction-modification system DNA methylase subunit
MSQATLGETSYRNAGLFTNYYLDNRVQDGAGWDCDEAATAAFDELQTLWERENELVDSYDEDELIDEWIQEVVEHLGYETRTETTLPDGGGFTDLLLYESETERRKAAESKRDGDVAASFATASAVLEAKQWGAAFDERFSEQRSYRDASHQLKYYLEHTPEDTDWGILTNGKQWRLYGTKDYATEIYYEVDLPELLANDDLEAFKYFFAFFRPAAFHETAGTSFLDTVWNESELAAQELGEDLQDSVFTAMRVLAEGFVETNDLSLDAGDDERLAELKEQSLVLLYRLMFVFYAESRGLIEPEEPDLRDEYAENFSLNTLRQEISERIQSGDDFDDFSEFSTRKWSRLENLFDLVDTGEEQLDIPAYNGGLFDPEDNQFLTENEVADRYLAEVIYRIGTAENDDGEDVLADYADLDTRHLGSIYEGLLEHEFRIAPEDYAAVADDGGQVWKPTESVAEGDAVETVESGDLYVVNDDGERKATGAYYTPDYVVSYIVEETVDPLLAEIHEDLQADGLEESDREYFRRFYESVRELTVLDPAMGSGHFLTTTVQYLTEQVMQVAREQDVGFGEQEIRRSISKECIYGVDVNGMAVELAKLSMWLETLAADKPLAFLDHHLKTGNSLVGSNIYDVLSEEGEDGKQTTLFDDFREIRTKTLAHVRDLMDDLVAIDNDELGDIKQMEETYDEIRGDPLYRRLLELANVHTAERFGLDVPDGVYETMAEAIEHEDEWQADVVDTDWCRSAQMMAAEEGFFHWELEFPEVFLNGNGQDEEGGFDVILGNPPYAKISAEEAQIVEESVATDLYAQFIARSQMKIGGDGFLSFITPTSWETGPNYDGTRQNLVYQGSLETIINLPYDVFEDAYVDTAIFVWKNSTEGTECHVADLSGTRLEPIVAVQDPNLQTFQLSDWRDAGIAVLDETWIEMSDRLSELRTLGEVTESTRGVLVTDESLESPAANTPICLDSYQRYEEIEATADVEYDLLREAPSDKHIFEGPRLLIRRLVSRSDRLLGTYSSEEFVSKKDVYVFKSDAYDERFLLALANSKLLSWWLFNVEMSASKDDFRQVTLTGVRELPVPDESDDSSDIKQPVSDVEDLDQSEVEVSELIDWISDCGGVSLQVQKLLAGLTRDLTAVYKKYNRLNLSLEDYIGGYQEGSKLTEIGFSQPISGISETPLTDTAEIHSNLEITELSVERDDSDSVVLVADLRYKPEDAERGEYETLGSYEAMRISDLTETEVDLIESFVPYAAENPDEMDDYRNDATKNITPIDRLRELTLPRVADVEQGLASYRRAMDRADELERQIERTDDLIDEIVYELYGLTDEEIEIVEESVGE